MPRPTPPLGRRSAPASATTVIRVSTMGPDDVYIGRPGRGLNGPWGNPIRLPPGGGAQARDATLRRYATWLLRQPALIARLGELRGRRLACFCAPRPCHGDVLAALADGEDVAAYAAGEIDLSTLRCRRSRWPAEGHLVEQGDLFERAGGLSTDGAEAAR